MASSQLSTLSAFQSAIAKLGMKYKNVIVFDCDEALLSRHRGFPLQFPGRYFQCGLSLSDMVGTASGMALRGKIVFICIKSHFLFDVVGTMRNLICIPGLNVKIVGLNSESESCPVRQDVPDIDLMKLLPGMKIFCPNDYSQTEEMMTYLVEHDYGPSYIRVSSVEVSEQKILSHTSLALPVQRGEVDKW